MSIRPESSVIWLTNLLEGYTQEFASSIPHWVVIYFFHLKIIEKFELRLNYLSELFADNAQYCLKNLLKYIL